MAVDQTGAFPCGVTEKPVNDAGGARKRTPRRGVVYAVGHERSLVYTVTVTVDVVVADAAQPHQILPAVVSAL
jgi:hypothetical protein